jgi:GT2 family glycosyltransferase
VFVVDNNSVDGSLKMVRSKFPEVILIANKDNTGFSKANNQAIKLSKGQYVLLLNPDTVVEDDTFVKVIGFMDQHPDAGGLGVRMVDGQGNFLPESKRGLPTPATAFYKIFGLSKVFPHSKRFGRYHLGYLDEFETHEVEILAGAFMLLRKETLDKVGLLDEAFFMYGEDIDLSYRITQGGYKNYYFPDTRIIHYKGESTKKSSVNYVFVFYNAMIIFARKHFSQKRAKTFTFLINIAIYFRAFLAIASRFSKRIALPLTDALTAWAGMVAIKQIWGDLTIYRDGGDYPFELVAIVIPVYIAIWSLAVYLSGGYDKPYKIGKSLRGLAIGTMVILVLYGLLPETYRFSRAIILLGFIWFTVVASFWRFAGHLLKLDGFAFGDQIKKRFLLIGSISEVKRVEEILKNTAIKVDFLGFVAPDEQAVADDIYIGNLRQVADIIQIYHINEIIFCSKDISHQTIIDKMTEWHESRVNYKIAPEDSLSIIGSNSINTSGDLYTVDIQAIDSTGNRRAKRMFDLLFSLLLIIGWPVLLWMIDRPATALLNALKVAVGKLSWVGYAPAADGDKIKLPTIREGVLCPTDVFKNRTIDADLRDRINLLYARDYSVLSDLNIFTRAFRLTGRKK